MKEYLIDNKKNLYAIKKLLDENNVLYEIESQIVLDKKYVLPRNLHKVFIIRIKNEDCKDIQGIFNNEREYLLEDINLKRINVKKSGIRKKVAIRDWLIFIFEIINISCMVGMKIAFNFEAFRVFRVMTWIALICILVTLFLSLKRYVLAAIDFIFFMAILAFGFSANYTSNHALDLLKIGGIEYRVAQYSLFACIMLMILSLFYIIYNGFKNYSNKNFIDKVKYCIAIGIGYITVVLVVIYGYANLISIYHNNLYIKYSNMLADASYKIEKESSLCIVEKKEITDNGYIVVKGFYNKEYGSAEKDFLPQYIYVSEYDENGNENFLPRYIEPETNQILNSNTFGSSMFIDYIYFSIITYFTIGYGDVYPIASTVKNWILQEAIIAHILTATIIPICLVIGQKFIEDKRN